MRALSSRQLPARGLIKTPALMVFVPGLTDQRLIGRLCAALEMPVNIILDAPLTPIDLETGCNVARISVGPLGYQSACQDLGGRFGACVDDVYRLSRALKTCHRKRSRVLIIEMPLAISIATVRHRLGAPDTHGPVALVCIAQRLQSLLDLVQNCRIINGCRHFKRLTVSDFNHCGTQNFA